MSIFGIDLITLIRDIGLIVVFLVLFAESGLFFAFFMPGDSLLFTAGLLASQGVFPLWELLIGGVIAAILGVNVGYGFGKYYGPKIFNREESVFFHKDHIRKAEEFYKKYGAFTIIIARFTPFVRTFAPIFAGIARMDYKIFMIYNVIGAFLWVFSISLAGFYLGKIVPDIEKFLMPIVAGIILVSIAPAIIKVWREYSKNKRG